MTINQSNIKIKSKCWPITSPTRPLISCLRFSNQGFGASHLWLFYVLHVSKSWVLDFLNSYQSYPFRWTHLPLMYPTWVWVVICEHVGERKGKAKREANRAIVEMAISKHTMRLWVQCTNVVCNLVTVIYKDA